MPCGTEAKVDNIFYDIFNNCSERGLAHYYEPDMGLFIAESVKITERALDAGYIPEYVLCEEGNASVTAVTERIGTDFPKAVFGFEKLDELKRITGYNLTGGILCAMRRRKLSGAAELLTGAKRIAVLEHVENPTNIGAIFRSAAALGMDAVLLTEDCCDPLYRRAIRVSMGTVFQIPWTYISGEWPSEGINLLHENGFKTVSMALRQDSFKLDDPEITSNEKLAVIMGTEGDGLGTETIAQSDYTVMIPMYHNVDSLNVAAASAVAFYEICRRKG